MNNLFRSTTTNQPSGPTVLNAKTLLIFSRFTFLSQWCVIWRFIKFVSLKGGRSPDLPKAIPSLLTKLVCLLWC